MTWHIAPACRLSSDRRVARRLLDLAVIVLTPAWGRDELKLTANQHAYPDVLPGQVLLADRYSITFPTPAALCGDASGALDGLPGRTRSTAPPQTTA
jgi:hypothetical protein